MIKKESGCRLPKSIRIHIRRQKAKIRRNCSDWAECQRMFAELYGRFRSGSNR